MSQLFSPIELRGLTIANRIVVAPMCQYIAEDGVMNDWHLVHLGGLSMGAGGLLITEATHVSHEGRISIGCLGLWNDAQMAAERRVLDFCRTHGTAKIGIQIAHAGRKASTHAGGNAPPLPENDPRAWQTLAPSAIAYDDGWPTPKAMDAADLTQVKEQFVESTRRAETLGFDLAQLHLAHGYLLHQFLSPLSNQRDDQYGGSLEDRIRYPLEVFNACRAVWPENKPLGIRISATDWVDGGWDLQQSIELAQAFKVAGCDFIDVSSGGLSPLQKITLKAGYQVEFASAIRQATGLNTWAVGLITGAQQAERIIANGEADMIAIARAAMADPRWMQHAALTLGVRVEFPKQYIRAHPDKWPGATTFKEK